MTLQINTSTGARDLTTDEQAEARAGLAAAAAADLSAHATSTSNPHAVTKAQVGLGNVDNTADTDKPVSTAQAAAIAAAVTAHTQAADPHPGYLTQSEAGELYSPTGAYIKPADGIPRQDLDHTIRGRLDLADTALQPGAQLTQAVANSTTAAGTALMTGDDAAAQRATLGLGTAATTASTAYATAAQGAKADSALPANADAIADVLEAAATGAPADLARIQASVSGASTDAGNLLSTGADSKLKLLGSAIAAWLAGLASNIGIGTASPLARLHVAGGNICVDNTYGIQGRLSSGVLATLMRYKADNKAYIGPNEELVLDGSCSIAPPGELTLSAGFASSTGPTIRPKTNITINSNGLIAFDAVSNTQVALKFRGNDGVTRSIVFTLS